LPFNRLGNIGGIEFALRFLARRGFQLHGCFSAVGAGRRSAAAPVIALLLDQLRDLQHMPEPLVLDDGALIDARDPVEGA
jgi:hypothetical protein